jgi:hypothetical protein
MNAENAIRVLQILTEGKNIARIFYNAEGQLSVVNGKSMEELTPEEQIFLSDMDVRYHVDHLWSSNKTRFTHWAFEEVE